MMTLRALALSLLAASLPAAGLSAPGDVSVERGKQVSIVGGCHECHTEGYNESAGVIDPAKALKGTGIGWRGPWGTTYAANLRLTVKDKTEDQFLQYAKEFKTRPPMPWFNVRAMDDTDLRSLFQYIKSLGAPGDPAPEALPPGQEPKTPFTVVAPPSMPKM
jgi:mono/diheme cytochrome c family protein